MRDGRGHQMVCQQWCGHARSWLSQVFRSCHLTHAIHIGQLTTCSEALAIEPSAYPGTGTAGSTCFKCVKSGRDGPSSTRHDLIESKKSLIGQADLVPETEFQRKTMGRIEQSMFRILDICHQVAWSNYKPED